MSNVFAFTIALAADVNSKSRVSRARNKKSPPRNFSSHTSSKKKQPSDPDVHERLRKRFLEPFAASSTLNKNNTKVGSPDRTKKYSTYQPSNLQGNSPRTVLRNIGRRPIFHLHVRIFKINNSCLLKNIACLLKNIAFLRNNNLCRPVRSHLVTFFPTVNNMSNARIV